MFMVIVGIALFVIGSVETAVADELTVIGFSHPPNYARCTDRDDMRQLTDGKLAPSPIWINKDTVGWAATTPIAIQLHLGGKEGVRSLQSGILRLHSAKGLSSGVDVPRHIDVYARDPHNKLTLVGSLDPESEKLADKNAYWLDVPVQGMTDSLVVVVHAAGVYLFLDEIRWQPSGTGRLPDGTRIEDDIRSALLDSTRRVSRALITGAELEAEKAALSLPVQAIYVWNEDPWGDIGSVNTNRQLSNRSSPVEVRGYAGERESVCLGIVVGKEIAVNHLRVQISGPPQKSMKLYEVAPVVAANKKRVYDPLIPLDEEGVVSARSGIPLYLWIDVDLAVLGAGEHQFTLHIEGGQRTVTVPGQIFVRDSKGSAKRPRAINWAYLWDMPIFRKGSVATQDLVDHGINTFVMHPSDIPGSSLDGTWEIKPQSHFVEVVELAKQHGMLLLYMGWSDTKNPLGFSNKTPVLDSAAKDRLVTWMKKTSAYLSEHGLPLDRWAVYVVDEPNLDGLKFTKAVAETIKQWNPQVQVYANLEVSLPIEVSDVRSADSVVDIWQPNRLVLRGPMADFFKRLQKEWWIYGNPKSPAKLGSPLRDYRMLAWWAWYYGASGVGFWSYSDTGGSSAWDDIDGRRPDWAVVYEGDNQIVSSRRWEAFREGLEDYTLLSAHNRAGVLKIMGTGEINFDGWGTARIEDVRRALLGTQ